MLFWCWFKAIFTSPFQEQPKRLTDHELEDIRNQTQESNVIKKQIRQGERNSDTINFDMIKHLQELTYCFKCQIVKLPRTHHCKTCGMCVTRMDHHCPWIANCVGKKNHKQFVQFTFYATFCCLNGVVIPIGDYFFNDYKIFDSLEKVQKVLMQSSMFMAFLLTLMIGYLFTFQIRMILQNMTTVEENIKEMHSKNPYKKSKLNNFKEVFGENPLYWFIPISEKKSKYNIFDMEAGL